MFKRYEAGRMYLPCSVLRVPKPTRHRYAANRACAIGIDRYRLLQHPGSKTMELLGCD
jgi:hypothetical protein